MASILSDDEMTLQFKVATANCGNDTLGSQAVANLVQQLTDESLDFMVINCQEVHFEDALEEINQALEAHNNSNPATYVCALTHQMPTHTKLSEFQRKRTGLTSFIIHKPTLNLNVTETIESRRSDRVWVQGYNKGGLISRLTFESPNGELVASLDTISAHLESIEDYKRITDWQGLFNHYHARSIENFTQLAKLLPHVVCLGMDANTRDIYSKNDKPRSPWQAAGDREVPSLVNAALSHTLYSAASTYKTDKDNLEDEDKNRPGRAKQGALDFCGVINATQPLIESEPQELLYVAVGEQHNLSLEDTSHRDHHIIVSPIQTFDETIDDFTRSKQFIALSLAQFSPHMAKKIQALEPSKSNKAQLVSLYNHYLAPHGLLHDYLAIQAKEQIALDKTLQVRFNQENLDALIMIDGFILAIYQMQVEALSHAKNADEIKVIKRILKQTLHELNPLKDLATLKDCIEELLNGAQCLLDMNSLFYDYGHHIATDKICVDHTREIHGILIDEKKNCSEKIHGINDSCTNAQACNLFSTTEELSLIERLLQRIAEWMKTPFHTRREKLKHKLVTNAFGFFPQKDLPVENEHGPSPSLPNSLSLRDLSSGRKINRV